MFLSHPVKFFFLLTDAKNCTKLETGFMKTMLRIVRSSQKVDNIQGIPF